MVIQHNPNPARRPQPGPHPRCCYFDRSARDIIVFDRPQCHAGAIFDGMCAWHCDMLYGRAWYALWNAGDDGLNSDAEREGLAMMNRSDVCDPTSYREWIAGE